MRRSLLALSYRFPPETYPLATRVKYFLGHLQKNWSVDAVTAAEDAHVEGVTTHRVSPREMQSVEQILQRLRLSKLLDLFAWPDPFVLWVLPALWRAWRLTKEKDPAAIVTFVMPYTTGIVGVLLKKLTGLPLVLNLNDSPTCTDMNSVFPSPLHHRLAYWLEDWFVRNADAVIYVSRRNMERVRDRQPADQHEKFTLIRRGVRPLPSLSSPPSRGQTFRIVYPGGMGGWYFGRPDSATPPSLLRRLYSKWQNWGKVYVERLDPSTHSPLYVGKAIRSVLDAHPEWKGRLQFEVYGNTYPESLTDTVLHEHGLEDIVRLHSPVPHEEVLQIIQKADLLFLTLPNRVNDTPGGRISAKTYEYLMTDRPILGALPPGENTEYLSDKPGTYLTAPDDVDGMANVIENLAGRAFSGEDLRVDRSALRSTLLSTTRARAFETVLEDVVPSTSTSAAPVPATSR